MQRPAVFLDRDGTIIEEVNYLSRVEDMRLVPTAREALIALKDHGFLLIVVTNQSGIGREIVSEPDMHAIHHAIQERVGSVIDAFYFCPHLPCDSCRCRKPATGMIDDAIADHGIDLQISWMIGDKAIDVETGRLAGMSTAMVMTGYGVSQFSASETVPDIVAEDIGEAAAKILSIAPKVVV